MPIVRPGSKILVTGGSGFVGTSLIRDLLNHGYTVRATVRRESEWLSDMFKTYGDKFETMMVSEDITGEGAFDRAVDGVDAIEHLASPVVFDSDPKDIIDPAVKGTLGILKSALKVHTIKRIVVLGSTASLGLYRRENDKPTVFTEKDWNEESIKNVERLGSGAFGGDKYCASKALAEKTAWSFYNEHKKDLSWDMVVLLPTYVLGPTLVPIPSPEKLNLSLRQLYDNVVRQTEKSSEGLADAGHGWVDVRDLATALSKALSVALREENVRLTITAGPFRWQDWRDVANKLAPFAIPSHAPGSAKPLMVGEPGGGKKEPYWIQFDGSKAQEVLGLSYRSMEETAKDTLAYFEKQGW